MSVNTRAGAQMLSRRYPWGGFLPFLAGLLGIAKTVSTIATVAGTVASVFSPPQPTPAPLAPPSTRTALAPAEPEFADVDFGFEDDLDAILAALEEFEGEETAVQFQPMPPAPLLTAPMLRTMPSLTFAKEQPRFRAGGRELL